MLPLERKTPGRARLQEASARIRAITRVLQIHSRYDQAEVSPKQNCSIVKLVGSINKSRTSLLSLKMHSKQISANNFIKLHI